MNKKMTYSQKFNNKDTIKMTIEQADLIVFDAVSLPRNAPNARYKVSGSHDVNHAQNGRWFASEASARRFAQAVSLTRIDDDFDVIQGGNVITTFCNGAEGRKGDSK